MREVGAEQHPVDAEQIDERPDEGASRAEAPIFIRGPSALSRRSSDVA
jgi:hypothetical protein